jgi:putative two-component system protein, hydrogenase maturation factor HypX/HoxX
MMSLAADRVWARAGCVVNPHYRTMGLYGSEYWTYLLPKRVGPGVATELTESALPLGMRKAKRIGLIDEIMPNTHSEFVERIKASAEQLANHNNYNSLLRAKIKARETDEMTRPLQAYRDAELQKMFRQFYDADSSYHELRRRFVEKTSRLACIDHKFNAGSGSGIVGLAPENSAALLREELFLRVRDRPNAALACKNVWSRPAMHMPFDSVKP